MMLRLLGQICLLVAFVGTGASACACIVGWRHGIEVLCRLGRAAGAASCLALSAAMGILLYALCTRDFHFAYVANYTSRDLPHHYAVSALWVGQAGSLLLWTWLSAVVAVTFRWVTCGRVSGDCRELREPTFGVLMAGCWFLAAAVVFGADPMQASLSPRPDGSGLSPILQHPSMLVHPPIVFLGYAAWSVPCALALAALATGRLEASWTRLARPWALFAWLVLGAGILLGAHWAYAELGWGGYWGWDPVENGSLIPWLLGTAAIHCMMAFRTRRLLPTAAVVLTIATFGMCYFATFLTRSGVFSSLHAFSQSPIGWLFLAGIGVLAAVTGGLLVRRRQQLRKPRPLATLACREALVIVAAVGLVSLATVTWAGTVTAAVSGAVTGRPWIVGPAFYNAALIPAGLSILAATAVAPLLNWGAPPSVVQRRMLAGAVVAGLGTATLLGIGGHPWLLAAVGGISAVAVLAGATAVGSSGLRRNPRNLISGVPRAVRTRRREYAGYIVHLGLFCLALGIAASALGSRREQLRLSPGQTVQWCGWQVQLHAVAQRRRSGRLVAEAELHLRRGAEPPMVLTPSKHFHRHHREWTNEVAIYSDWAADVYTILHDGEDPQSAQLTLVHNPMVRWIWLGGWIMGFGAVAGLVLAPRTTARRTGAAGPPRAVRRVDHGAHPMAAFPPRTAARETAVH